MMAGLKCSHVTIYYMLFLSNTVPHNIATCSFLICSCGMFELFPMAALELLNYSSSKSASIILVVCFNISHRNLF
jgi:hypothetical protein